MSHFSGILNTTTLLASKTGVDGLLNKIPVPIEALIKGILVIITTTYFITNPFNGK